MSNPLLADFNTPFQMPPFQEVEVNHYLEAIDQSLAEAKSEISAIIENSDLPTFENVIEALEEAGQRLSRTSSILFNLNSAETSDELQKIAQEISPKLSAFSSEVKQNDQLFAKVKELYQQRDELLLNDEQKRLLKVTYKDFVRRGVELEGEKKDRFKAISVELSKLSLTYQEHLLTETNSYELLIESEKDLSGLP